MLAKDSRGSEPLVIMTALAGATCIMPLPTEVAGHCLLDLISSLVPLKATIDIQSNCNQLLPLQFKNGEGGVLEYSALQNPWGLSFCA